MDKLNFYIPESYAIIAIGLGGIFSLSNWVGLYKSWRNKKFVSPVPIVGALLLGLGLSYFEKTRYYAFLSAFVDYGTLVLIISTPSLAKQFWEVSRFNLIQTFVGQAEHTKYELKLYRKGIFVIEADVEPPQIANEYGVKISHFGFQGKWDEKKGIIQLSRYDGDRTAKVIKTGNNYLASEDNYPEDRKYKYDLLNNIEFIAVSEGEHKSVKK